ncbi:MAG: chitobiase/beta-hexosaminidase C-terminal domain-containing protein [Phycisphaerales bacterium]
MGKSYSLMQVNKPGVSISAAKKAEEGDEVIVRLREHMGMPTKDVRVALGLPIVSAREVDGQERQIGTATVNNGELVTDMHGYGVRAFAVKLGSPTAKVAAAESKPITLTFDTDVVSTNASFTDGSMDADRSFPAEMLPASLTSEGVKFNLGATTDGQKNAVACNGQTVNIPEGCDRLYILAAANVDTNSSLTVDGQTVPWSVQAWNGYVGQWDRRIWAGEITESSEGNGEIVGLEPGFVKDDAVAWFSSHYHTKAGNTFYEYCYLYKYGIDVPAGAKSVTLPTAPGIKVFAMTGTKGGGARVKPAAPLFDTLADHRQDAPVISPASGAFSDTTEVRIQPNMYFRAGAVHYTTDGSEPTAQSPLYHGPLTLTKASVVKAAVMGRDGKLSPAASADLKVNDQTAPKITAVEAVYQSPTLRVDFSEPVAAAAASNFTLSPAVAVTKAELQPNGRSVVLTLASAPELNKPYTLTVDGVADASPAGNKVKAATSQFTAAGPVYTLNSLGADQRGKTINVPNLPTKAGDKWTMNMFVKLDKQLPNRTIIAGFGKCDDGGPVGGARYMAKFGGGAHFWSRNQDVASRTQLELNKWQMLTATYDGKTLRLYKDGKKIGEGTPNFADDVSSVSLAPKDPWEQMRQFDGELRNFTIWNAALGEGAIATLAKDTPK